MPRSATSPTGSAAYLGPPSLSLTFVPFHLPPPTPLLLGLHAVFIFKRVHDCEVLKPAAVTKQEQEKQADDVAPAGSAAFLRTQPSEAPQAEENKDTVAAAAERKPGEGEGEMGQRHEAETKTDEGNQCAMAPAMLEGIVGDKKGAAVAGQDARREGTAHDGVARRKERKRNLTELSDRASVEVDEAQRAKEAEWEKTGREEEQRMKGGANEGAAQSHATKRHMEGGSSFGERGRGKKGENKGKAEKESIEKVRRLKDVPAEPADAPSERRDEAVMMPTGEVTETHEGRQDEGATAITVTFSGRRGKKAAEANSSEGDQIVRDGKKAGKGSASETGGRKKVSGKAAIEQETSECTVRAGGLGAELAAVAAHEDVTVSVREWEEEEEEVGVARINLLRLQADLQAGPHRQWPATLPTDPSSVGGRPSWCLLQRSLSAREGRNAARDQGAAGEQPATAAGAGAGSGAGPLSPLTPLTPLTPVTPLSARWGGVGKKPRSFRRTKSLTFGAVDDGSGEAEGEEEAEAGQDGLWGEGEGEEGRGGQEGVGNEESCTLVGALPAALPQKRGLGIVDDGREVRKDGGVDGSREDAGGVGCAGPGDGEGEHSRPIAITYARRR